MYPPEFLDHFQNPRNAGALGDPAVRVQVTNPACGDSLRLSARTGDGRIVAITFQAVGCSAALAAGSALTELVLGQPVARLREITYIEIEAALGGLPPASRHAAGLAADAAHALAGQLAG